MLLDNYTRRVTFPLEDAPAAIPSRVQGTSLDEILAGLDERRESRSDSCLHQPLPIPLGGRTGRLTLSCE